MTSTSVNRGIGARVKRLNQHFGPLIASFGGFAFGVSLAWNSLAVEVFRRNLDATAIEIGLVGAVLNGGASLGALLVPFGVRYMKHIHLIALTLPVLFIGWMFICLGGQRVTSLIIGRVVCGVSIGATCILAPTFVAEVADKKKREQVLSYFQLLCNFGVMYAFLVAHFISMPTTIWRYSLLCMVPCLLIQLIHLLPESPLHHLGRDDKKGAKESFQWYRGGTVETIDEEFTELERLAVALRSQKISLRILKKWNIMKACLSCLLILLIQQLCGVNAMIFYARSLFEHAGSGELSESELTLVVAAVQILSCLLASVLLIVVSRRVLLAISCSLMGLFLISLGWFFHLRQTDPEYDEIYAWMPPTWISLFIGAYNIGVGPISWAILGDTLPMEIRIPAAACIVSFSWLTAFIVNLHFVQLVMMLGVPKLMCLNAGFCFAAGFCCVFLSVDNKGKSLTQIHEIFHPQTTETLPADTTVET